MKTRNLLLAGLVAVAMSACSNNEDFVDDNNQPLERNAEMQITFSFPQATGTRAGTEESTGDKNEGSDLEYGVSKVTAVLVYEGTNKVIVTKDLDISGDLGADKVWTATTEAFAVSAGKATVYAVINKNNVNITTTNYENALLGADYTSFLSDKGFNYLTESIAKDENFLMSGVSAPVDITTTGIAKATISANRVSAKLDEKTDKSIKDLTNATVKTEDGRTIGISITKYAYTNLAENSTVFNNKGQKFTSESPLHKYSITTPSYTFISNEINNPTYCLENIRGIDPANAVWYNEPSTNVLYEGQVCLKDADGKYENIDNNFYIKAEYVNSGDILVTQRTLFKDYASLRTKYSNLPAEEIELTKEMMTANGLVQYEGGKCYYGSVIKHTVGSKVTTDIVRNNWYKLSVTSIKDLGYPTPIPPSKEDDAKLQLQVLIQPWTFQINDIEL